MKRIRTKSQPTVDFSERRGKVCGPACRANEMLGRERDRALRRGWKTV